MNQTYNNYNRQPAYVFNGSNAYAMQMPMPPPMSMQIACGIPQQPNTDAAAASNWQNIPAVYRNNNSGFAPPPPPPPAAAQPPPPHTQLTSNWQDLPIPEDWSSIYIPRIDFRMTREELSYLIETTLNLGSVLRIDFAPAKDGSGRMAYIHMDFNKEPNTLTIRDIIVNDGSWEVFPEYNCKYPIKLRFMINRRPVPKTEFTIETLADSMARMSYTVEQHGVDVKTQDERIETISQDLHEYNISMKTLDTNLINTSSAMETRIKELEKTVCDQDMCLKATNIMIREMQIQMQIMMDKLKI